MQLFALPERDRCARVHALDSLTCARLLKTTSLRFAHATLFESSEVLLLLLLFMLLPLPHTRVSVSVCVYARMHVQRRERPMNDFSRRKWEIPALESNRVLLLLLLLLCAAFAERVRACCSCIIIDHTYLFLDVRASAIVVEVAECASI